MDVPYYFLLFFLAIAFTSYANGAVKNSYGVQPYAVGENLFRLQMEDGVLKTYLDGLRDDALGVSDGVLFLEK